MSYPNLVRPGHKWLGPLLDYLDKGLEVAAPSGTSGAQAAWLGRQVAGVQVGNATGVVGLYGATGLAPVATGGNGILSATYLGASGFASTGVGGSGLYTHLARFADNGGSGTPYTFSDAIRALKNLGAIPK